MDALREATGIVETAASDTVLLSDSSDMPLRGLNLYGKTKQKTTTGKNLWPYGDFEGNTTSGLSLMIPAGTFSISRKTANNNLTFRFFTSPDLSNTEESFIHASTVTHTVITTEKPIYGCNYFATSSTGTDTDVQFEVGNTATAYEPYTGGIPSPNPDYPQPLESVGDKRSVTVTACGNNLLVNNKKTATTASTVQYKVLEDGRYTLEGTSASSGVVCLWPTTPSYDRNNIGTGKSLFLMKAGRTYYMSGAQLACRKVSDGTAVFIRNDNAVSASAQYAYKPTEDLEIIQFRAFIQGGKTYTADVVREPTFSTTPMTEYEQANPYTINIPILNGLPGIPVTSGGNYTDESGQQWICDEVDFTKGVYIQRVQAYHFTDASVWTISSDVDQSAGTTRIKYNIPEGYIGTYGLSNYTAKRTWWAAGANELGLGNAAIRRATLYLSFGAVLTIEEISAMFAANPLEVHLILAAPIVRELTEAEKADYTALHTNYPNTTVFNDENAGMGIRYIADTKLYIDNKFQALEAAIAKLI